MRFSDFIAVSGLTGIMALAGCSTGAPNMDGSYKLTDIGGTAVSRTMILNISGTRLSGNGSCNNFSTENAAQWPEVSLSPIALTRRACIEGGENETRYFTALAQVTSAEKTEAGIVLSGPEATLNFMNE